MRAMIVHPGPSYSVADVHDGLVKGLRANGVDVKVLNLDDRLNFYSEAHIKRGKRFVRAFDADAAIALAANGIKSACYDWWPDLLIVVSGFFVPPTIWASLKRRPHHVVLWCTESPYEDDRQASAAKIADTVILNDPLNLEMYREEHNPRTYYLPHSYDPTIHHPEGRCEVHDFGFVGTGFPSRVKFFEHVNWDGIDARFGGNWTDLDETSPLYPLLTDKPGECMNNATAAELYRACRVTANLYRKEHSEHGTAQGIAIGPREVELAACGSFFLREARPEGDQLFPMLPTFRSVEEFQSLLRWSLDHPEERDVAARAARAAIADRTFIATAARLLRMVDGATKQAA